MIKWKWIVFSVLFSLTACHSLKPDARTDTAIQTVLDELRRPDSPILESHLPPELQSTDALTKISEIKKFVPNEDPVGKKLVNFSVFKSFGGGKKENIVTEYDYGDRKAILETNFYWPNEDEVWQISALSFHIANLKELKLNRFTLFEKTGFQYLFLGFCVLSPILMVVALIKVVRMRALRRKWLWAIAAIMGLFSFHMNWTNGQVAVNWLTVQFIGAGIARPDSQFYPWILTMTFPIGAILILMGMLANPTKRKKTASTNDSETVS